jgi:hypothetical protein
MKGLIHWDPGVGMVVVVQEMGFVLVLLVWGGVSLLRLQFRRKKGLMLVVIIMELRVEIIMVVVIRE